MKKLFFIIVPFYLFSKVLWAQEKSNYLPQKDNLGPSLYLINSQNRMQDLIQIYQQLRTEKPTYKDKIFFRTITGLILNNIQEIIQATNGTMLLFKTLAPKGTIVYTAIFTEQIAEIGIPK